VTHNRDYDLNAVIGAAQSDPGVPHGRLLVEFAEAVLGKDEAALTRARAALSEAQKAEVSADFRAALGVDRFDVATRT